MSNRLAARAREVWDTVCNWFARRSPLYKRAIRIMESQKESILQRDDALAKFNSIANEVQEYDALQICRQVLSGRYGVVLERQRSFAGYQIIVSHHFDAQVADDILAGSTTWDGFFGTVWMEGVRDGLKKLERELKQRESEGLSPVAEVNGKVH